MLLHIDYMLGIWQSEDSDVTLELKQVGVELRDLRLNSRDSRDTQLSLLKTQDVTHSRIQLVISLTPNHPLDRW